MKNQGILSLSSIFGMVMIVVVLTLAAGIAFTDMLSDRLYGNKRIFFIFLLIAYAVYRGIRVYQSARVQREKH